MEEEETVSVHVVVQGKVQGVGFRIFTEQEANQRGLHGWVRNHPDGTVEVEAEGPRPEVEAFIKILREGPKFSHVSQIIVDWKDANRHTHGFTIQRS